MADPPSSPATLDPKLTPSEPDNPNSQSNQPDPLPLSSSPLPSSTTTSTPAPLTVNPNSNLPVITPPPPSIPSYAPPPISGGTVVPPTAPSFRPAAPQFSPLLNPQNPNFQNPGVPPPGVSPVPGMVPGMVSGAGSITVSVSPMMQYQAPPGQPPNPAMRPYAPMPNGYPNMPMPAPQGMPPPGVPRYPSPYTTMVRPAFPPRPPGAMGMLPVLSRPPVPGIHGVRPIIPPVIRPAVIPIVTPAEKPQTTVYVGKISPTVENDFMLSLLRLCGPVKSWKRAQDPTDGTPRGFGFCEFESAEGVLRALRLLSKLNVDGQELVLNVNQATREYLERYVEKKTENSKKLKETEAEGVKKEEESAPGPDKNEPLKPSLEDLKKDENDSGNKENQDTANFGIVTDEDREADREALDKLTSMMEERFKTKPLPPPPPPPQAPGDGSGNSNWELPTKSRDGDSDVDIMRNDATEDKNDDDTTSENKLSEHDRPETSSPDRSRRYDRRSRDIDNRERDLKREKEREFERLERETQRERDRKERERERKIQEAERAEREYKERVREWESRERDREKQRQHEKEREKERERKRKKEIKDDESDDEDSRKRMRRGALEEKRRKRLREKEEEWADKVKEEEEIAEAQRRAIEEQQQQQQQQQQKDALKLLSGHVINGTEKIMVEETHVEIKDETVEQADEGDSGHGNHIGDRILQNGNGDESTMATVSSSDTRQSSNVPARKLGFGLVGSGKRTAVPSVFYEEEDDDAQKEKKMRPLVPIDYSTEELQAVQLSNNVAAPPNLAAAAEFAKRISHVNPREEKLDTERERSRRSHDRSSHRDKDRNDEDINRTRDENREKILDRDRDREHGADKLKTPDNKKLLDAKQLIDMIPKTKEELFSYEIDWAVYDKHELHERMRPWISKKITEFLGEEETTLVDYIVSSTQEHVKASQMLELLQTILDDEAEMFVLKMWRMLIFEIKKVETGLSLSVLRGM